MKALASQDKKRKSGKGYLASGVKRLFVISMTPEVPEDYSNIQKEMELLEITDIATESIILSDKNVPIDEFQMAADLKLQNILVSVASSISANHMDTSVHVLVPISTVFNLNLKSPFQTQIFFQPRG